MGLRGWWSGWWFCGGLALGCVDPGVKPADTGRASGDSAPVHSATEDSRTSDDSPEPDSTHSGIHSGDSGDDTAVPTDDSADTAADCPDTGDGTLPGDDTGEATDACDGDLVGVRDTKLCGQVASQRAGYALSAGSTGPCSPPAIAIGDYTKTGEVDAYVTYGDPTNGWLSDLTHIGGLVDDQTPFFAIAVEISGDYDGDGYVDLAAGAPFADLGYADGRLYVYAGPIDTSASVDTYDAAVNSVTPSSYFGMQLAGVDDLEGDGDDELLVGNSWSSFVGSATLLTGPIESMTISDAAANYTHVGHNPGDAVAAGDLDGDGVQEVLLLDSPDGDFYGSVWIVPADRRGNIALLDETAVSGTDDYPLWSWDIEAGDVNGDGYADLLTQYATDTKITTAAVWAGPITTSVDITAAAATLTFREDYAIFYVGICGDLNGDAQSGDLILGIPGLSQLHTVSAPISGAVELDSTTLIAEQESDADQFGAAITCVPDLDHDGYDDLIIGAPYNDEGATDGGAVYTLFGGSW